MGLRGVYASNGRDRGVSAVVGTLLLVVIVVIGGVLVGALAIGFSDDVEDSGPTVAVSAKLDATDQVVRVTHESGDALAVANLEIVVTLEATGASTRLVDLPVTADSIDPGNVEGDDVLDQSPGETEGAISDGSPDTDGEWSAGETIRFRVNENAGDGYDIAPGDEVTVRIVHTESESVLVQETVVAG